MHHDDVRSEINKLLYKIFWNFRVTGLADYMVQEETVAQGVAYLQGLNSRLSVER